MDMHLSVLLIGAALIIGYLFGLSEGTALVESLQPVRYPL